MPPAESWTFIQHAVDTGPDQPGAGGDEIEVGAAADELRLWRAREALRQVELSLRPQTDARDNLRAAATSLLGWSVTAIGAVAAAALSATHAAWRGAAMIAIVALLVTAALCVVALFPRAWARPGYDTTQISSTARTRASWRSPSRWRWAAART